MKISVIVNQSNFFYREHMRFIFQYIETYYYVSFKLIYQTNIKSNTVLFKTEGKQFVHKLNTCYFNEYIREDKLKSLWSEVFDYIALDTRKDFHADILGFMFSYMNTRDEIFILDDERTKYGNVNRSSSFVLKRKFLHLPVVDMLIDKVFVKRFRLRPRHCSPTYVRSSDCDSANWRNNYQQTVNIIKSAIRFDPIYFALTSFTGVPSSSTCNIEYLIETVGNHATVFLPHIAGRRAINDVKSHLSNNSINWNSISRFCEDGLEIGLHASLQSGISTSSLAESKQYIETYLEMPIYGCRHHYWNIDWKKPWLTYRKHLNAGLKYDASFAIRDTFGFRNGMCRPFKPFDYDRSRSLDFYVIPTFLMDSHILKMPSTSVDLVSHMDCIANSINVVRELNGFLVVDWHTETFIDRGPYAGFKAGLLEFENVFINETNFVLKGLWECVRSVHIKASE